MPGCSEPMTAAGAPRVRKAVWREDDVAQDRPPSTTKFYWVKMTDTDHVTVKTWPVQREESNNIKRSLCSPS